MKKRMAGENAKDAGQTVVEEVKPGSDPGRGRSPP